jgi:hypothetical protein
MVGIQCGQRLCENFVDNFFNLLSDITDLAEKVEAISDEAEIALRRTGKSKYPTPKRKPFAQRVELSTKKIFETYFGQGKAHVNFDGASSKSYGPYVDFVHSLFSEMEIKASAVGVIKTRTKKVSCYDFSNSSDGFAD